MTCTPLQRACLWCWAACGSLPGRVSWRTPTATWPSTRCATRCSARDTDDRWKGVDSTELLAAVLALPEFSGWSVVNADITIALQAPKLAPHIAAMRSRLAEVMGISPDRVSVKATTTEHLGFVGRREGCEVWAIVLIARK